MRKVKSIPRIVKINEVREFSVYCAFNNGEHRIINFQNIFEKFNFYSDELRKQVTRPDIFKTVVLKNNTLAWEQVRKIIKLKTGKTLDVVFELDPIVLYENSESDDLRNKKYEIGEIIKDQRIKAGLTQQQLALKCGTTRNYISRIENNRSDIELTTLRKIIEIGLGKDLKLQVS